MLTGCTSYAPKGTNLIHIVYPKDETKAYLYSFDFKTGIDRPLCLNEKCDHKNCATTCFSKYKDLDIHSVYRYQDTIYVFYTNHSQFYINKTNPEKEESDVVYFNEECTFTDYQFINNKLYINLSNSSCISIDLKTMELNTYNTYIHVILNNDEVYGILNNCDLVKIQDDKLIPIEQQIISEAYLGYYDNQIYQYNSKTGKIQVRNIMNGTWENMLTIGSCDSFKINLINEYGIASIVKEMKYEDVLVQVNIQTQEIIKMNPYVVSPYKNEYIVQDDCGYLSYAFKKKTNNGLSLVHVFYFELKNQIYLIYQHLFLWKQYKTLNPISYFYHFLIRNKYILLVKR